MSDSEPSQAALRAATTISQSMAGQVGEAPPSSMVAFIGTTIDRETGLRNMVDVLEKILAQAGDLLESRSAELVVQARAALRHSAEPAPRED